MTDQDLAQFQGDLYRVLQSFASWWHDLVIRALGPMPPQIEHGMYLGFWVTLLLFIAMTVHLDAKQKGPTRFAIGMISALLLLALGTFISGKLIDGRPAIPIGAGITAATVLAGSWFLIFRSRPSHLR